MPRTNEIAQFINATIVQLWPAMNNKKIEFHNYQSDEVYNTVALGINAPVSTCCKSRLNF